MKRNVLIFVISVVSAAMLVACGQRQSTRSEPAKPSTPVKTPSAALAGSTSCRDCHEDFYKLWSDSWHGLAMQPYSKAFTHARLTPQEGEITIGKNKYRAEIGAGAGRVLEIGPRGDRKYPIAHVMGGKNVYFFLTPMERGRLQVLPLAYDVHQKVWYDMAASGVRHFPDRDDEALDWTDRMFTFNTACFNCHVTQLETNYDLATDTYHTTWSEPGISCESCHGPAQEHVLLMESCEEGHVPEDIKIIRTKDFSPAEMNDMCLTCHAKLVPLSLAFQPGEKFFDHFDLVTLENIDFYPDGRDLGENYTNTWKMSPCAASGQLDCNHCHTPSGRMRYQGEESNRMCLPCHTREVKQPAEHGHHAAESEGNKCVACHMPMTRFASMNRSDHSMRPPMPAATIKFQSPNACNLCHTDEDAAWADEWVRKWDPRDYQAEPLRRAELIDAARKQQWQRLPEMLAELRGGEGGEVYTTSLLRLLAGCGDDGKWPVMLELLKDQSPLVRSSAASVLGEHLTPETIAALLAAAADPARLVRIRAAMSLSPLRPESLSDQRDGEKLERANRDFLVAMQARSDDWASSANLGNFYMQRGDYAQAAASFATATKLDARQIGPLVNASFAYSNLARNDEAERCLRRALEFDPENAAVNFNLGLLSAERGRIQDAEQSLRAALKSDPKMAPAAFNLGVLLADKNPEESIEWCRKAHELSPLDEKYAHTLAFYLKKSGDADAAAKLLRKLIENNPSYMDAYLLLGEIYEGSNDFSAAAKVYHDASRIEQLPNQMRRQLETKSRAARDRRLDR